MKQAWPLLLVLLAVAAGYLAWWWRNGRKKSPADTQPVSAFPSAEELLKGEPPQDFTPLADLLEKDEVATKFLNERAAVPPDPTKPPPSTRHTDRRVIPDRRKKPEGGS